MSTASLNPSSASSREKYKWKRCDESDAPSLEESRLAMRLPRGGGLTIRENAEDSRRESEGDECSEWRHIHYSAMTRPARVAHRSIPSTSGDIHPGNFNAVFLPLFLDDSLNYGTGDTYGYLAEPTA